MIVKVHKIFDGRYMVTVCDKNLIGKKFEEKNLQLDLTSKFYKGVEKDENEVKTLLRKCHILNMVGKKSVDLGIKVGIIPKKSVMFVKNIPHAQVIML